MKVPVTVRHTLERRPVIWTGEGMTESQLNTIRDVVEEPDFDFACSYPPTPTRTPGPFCFVFYTKDEVLHVWKIGQTRVLNRASCEAPLKKSDVPKGEQMNRKMAEPYVAFVVNDAGDAAGLGDNEFAKIYPYSRLVGWQCGFEPLFVAVHSYVSSKPMGDEEAIDLALDYLKERGWFGASGPREPDYVL